MCATMINIVVALIIAYHLAHRDFKGKNLLDIFLTLPLVLPPTVMGYYLLVLFGSEGWLGKWLSHLGINLVFTWQGAVVAATIVSMPLIIKPARAAFEAVNPQFEDAARTLGISNAGVFFRITLPLAFPGILAGILMAFARCLGEFGATLMIAGSIPGKTQTLSIAVYEAVQAGKDTLANELVLLISVICMVILYTVQRLGTKHKPQRLR